MVDLTLGNPVMPIRWPDAKPKTDACDESKAGRSFDSRRRRSVSLPELADKWSQAHRRLRGAYCAPWYSGGHTSSFSGMKLQIVLPDTIPPASISTRTSTPEMCTPTAMALPSAAPAVSFNQTCVAGGTLTHVVATGIPGGIPVRASFRHSRCGPMVSIGPLPAAKFSTKVERHLEKQRRLSPAESVVGTPRSAP